ncbi:MAG TPA: peptidoglycan DD-metalloendopeptidase family protein [Vicinamibacterales bacterium]|nr:peptidoglycan DD-metalloendopeptidase family protein [Vicinamibacterales bacterium]
MRPWAVGAAAVTALILAGCTREPAPPARPARADVVLPVEAQVIESIVPRQATLESLLLDHDLPSHLVQAAIDSARSVFNPRQLRAERPYRLVVSVDGLLHEFEYQIDADRFLRIVNRDRSTPDKLDAEVLPYDKDTDVIAIQGRIDGDHPSLFAAMDATGERVQLALALAEIFGGQVDFENDLQPGDTFEVLFETTSYKGSFAGYGAILAARLMNDGKTLQAYRWVNPSTEKAGYYDEQGRSLRRFFLASPLRFTPRVTSGFSLRRMHPVHRTVRAHLGVDYAAVTGTPVVAVADGVVISAGWAGGGGRQVRIRHAGGLESYYLHLSAFGKGIRAGARVDQGQLIGRVGATGTATGPHLDYRLRRKGVFVDPRREHARQPPGEPIPASFLAAFHDARGRIGEQLAATLAAPAPPPVAATRAAQH